MRSALLVALATLGSADRPPPRETISLDLPPSTRWVALATKYNATMHDALQLLIDSQPYFVVLLAVASRAFASEASTAGWLPAEHRAELDSIARVTALPVGQLILLHSLYDLTASGSVAHDYCTSIVAQPVDEGAPPVHGRNLDYPLRKAMLLLAIQLDWQRANHTVFSSVTVLPQVSPTHLEHARVAHLTSHT
jgi:hypothetical protein